MLLPALPAFAQTVTVPQRPFAQLAELWGRQLDRVADRLGQPGLLPGEIDVLRDQTSDVRLAVLAAAAIARDDLVQLRALLTPLEGRAPGDTSPEAEQVRAERERLGQQVTLVEGRVRQSELLLARADQLLQRLARARGAAMVETLVRVGPSPLSPKVWRDLGAEIAASQAVLERAVAAWSRKGLAALASGEHDLRPIGLWALFTIAIWWSARALRRRLGQDPAEGDTAPRDRVVAASVDGIGLVLVPVLLVWLVDKLLDASLPPAPLDLLVSETSERLIVLFLVFGFTATMLRPRLPAWRVLPFSDDAAARLSRALRRLIVGYGVLDLAVIAYVHDGEGRTAIAAVGALVMATGVTLLALPALASRAWLAQPATPDAAPRAVGGGWWAFGRLLLGAAMLSSVLLALLGYSVLATHLHSALAGTGLVVAGALLAHRLASGLIEAAAAADTPPGRWARQRLGLAPDAQLRGHQALILILDVVLVLAVSILVPVTWGVDVDNILRGLGRLFTGVKVGGVTIALADIGVAILAFGVAVLIVRTLRRVVRDRVMPTLDAPVTLRQSIDAGLNYVGLLVALLIGVTALGVDFSNLALILGALSVGIGLGLQNIANNVISGIILLIERPIRPGDWVVVDSHEGIVRRINIRATEIETFARTSVIVPNSLFLQSPVINRTYADTSSRVEIALTVAYGSDVGRVEAILREVAIAHPRVLRIPGPIVRFLKLGSDGLEFQLFAFVAALDDRVVVGNDLNRQLLARLSEAGIEISTRTADVRLRDIDALTGALREAVAGRPGSDKA